MDYKNMRNIALSFAISALCVIGFSSNTALADPAWFPGGDGTEASPYQIETCTQLQAIGDSPATLAAHYVLNTDIDCTATASWNLNPAEWDDGTADGNLIEDDLDGVTNNGYFGFDPIGTDTEAFTGVIDGNDKTISGLWIFRKAADNVGIIGYADGANIFDLSVVDSKVVGGANTGTLIGSGSMMSLSKISISDSMARAYLSTNGGGVVGQLEQSSCVEDLSVADTFVHGSGIVIGGLVGRMEDSCILNATVENIHVDGGQMIGGAVGRAENSSLMNVHTSGEAIGVNEGGKNGWQIGGLIGYGIYLDIDQSSSSVNVTSDTSSVGGLVGELQYADVYDSFATGRIEGEYDVGGLIGLATGVNIYDSFATGTVVGDQRVGGLIGSVMAGSDEVTVSSSYAIGEIDGNSDFGGLIGEVFSGLIGEVFMGSTPVVNNSFWDTETTGVAVSDGGGTGKTTAEMKNIATYTNLATVGLDVAWDFIGTPGGDANNYDLWHIWADESVNNGYPCLTWMDGCAALTAPTIVPQTVNNVTKTTASVVGQVTNLGGGPIDKVVISYGTESIADGGVYSVHQFDYRNESSPFTFTFNLSNLTCETTYYYTLSTEHSDPAGFDGESMEMSFATSSCSTPNNGGVHLIQDTSSNTGGSNENNDDSATEDGFLDTKGHWAEEYIETLRAKGVVQGKSKGIFAPDDFVTRAELMKMVLEAYEYDSENVSKTSFSDVRADQWFAKYVERAKLLGFVKGYEDGTFKPNASVNRAEALAMVLQSAGIELKFTKAHLFGDTVADAWYADLISFAVEKGIVSGYENGNFGPSDKLTRAQAAKIIVLTMALR